MTTGINRTIIDGDVAITISRTVNLARLGPSKAIEIQKYKNTKKRASSLPPHYGRLEAAPLRSIVLRYAGFSIATRVSFFLFFSLFFVYLEMSLFPSIFPAFSLYGEYVVRSFLPDGVFPTL